MNHCPFFSVVLCVNRTNPWFADAVRSVLTQGDSDFEFLIAANACEDALVGEIEQLVTGDARVSVFRSQIGQLPYNLNLLADQARGEYLIRMDADDVCEPTRFSTLRKRLASKPVDILGSAVVLIDSQSKVVGEMHFPETHRDIMRALPQRTVFCHPSVAIRRGFLIKVRGYSGGFASEDLDLWIRAASAGASMENIDTPLLRYRVHGGQTISGRQGYAEVAALWLREVLLRPSWWSLKGLIVAVAKALFRRAMPGARAYFRD